MTEVTEWVKRQILAPMSGWYLLMFVVMWFALGIFVMFIPTACGTIETQMIDSGQLPEDFHNQLRPAQIYQVAAFVWWVVFSAYIVAAIFIEFARFTYDLWFRYNQRSFV